MSNKKTLVLKPCRIASPKLTEPDNYQGQGKRKYQIRALFPKGDKETMVAIKKFAEETVAASALKAEEKKAALKNCTVTKDHDYYYFKDGDKKQDYAGHEGHYYLNLKASGETKTGETLPPPPVYFPKQPGEKMRLIPHNLISAEIYSGCWVVIIIRAWASALPKPGVFLQINEIMKFKDDEPFRKSEFDSLDIEVPEVDSADIEDF